VTDPGLQLLRIIVADEKRRRAEAKDARKAPKAGAVQTRLQKEINFETSHIHTLRGQLNTACRDGRSTYHLQQLLQGAEKRRKDLLAAIHGPKVLAALDQKSKETGRKGGRVNYLSVQQAVDVGFADWWTDAGHAEKRLTQARKITDLGARSGTAGVGTLLLSWIAALFPMQNPSDEGTWRAFTSWIEVFGFGFLITAAACLLVAGVLRAKARRADERSLDILSGEDVDPAPVEERAGSARAAAHLLLIRGGLILSGSVVAGIATDATRLYTEVSPAFLGWIMVAAFISGLVGMAHLLAAVGITAWVRVSERADKAPPVEAPAPTAIEAGPELDYDQMFPYRTAEQVLANLDESVSAEVREALRPVVHPDDYPQTPRLDAVREATRNAQAAGMAHTAHFFEAYADRQELADRERAEQLALWADQRVSEDWED
jgi:hypothetical protein